MNKKDIRSLMEAYEEVASFEVAPEEHSHHEDDSDFSKDIEPSEHLEDGENLENLEHEKIRMVETRLRSVVAHAHQAVDAIKKGSVIEPWMQDLITSAEEHIVKVANVLVYRHDID
jgi:hypothetical protein